MRIYRSRHKIIREKGLAPVRKEVCGFYRGRAIYGMSNGILRNDICASTNFCLFKRCSSRPSVCTVGLCSVVNISIVRCFVALSLCSQTYSVADCAVVPTFLHYELRELLGDKYVSLSCGPLKIQYQFIMNRRVGKLKANRTSLKFAHYLLSLKYNLI